MPTLEDLYRRTKVIIDDTADNINLSDWYNECQNDLLNILYLPTRTTITKDGTGFAVPSDFNGEMVVLTELDATETIIYDDYIHFEGEDDVTEIEIQYNKLPAEITTTLTQIPDIPERFHSVYISYAAMQYCQVEEEFDRYAYYERKFSTTVAALRKFMSKARPKPARWEVER